MEEESLAVRIKKREEERKRTIERQRKYSIVVLIIMIVSISIVFLAFKFEKPNGMKNYIQKKYGTVNKNIKKNKREEIEKVEEEY